MEPLRGGRSAGRLAGSDGGLGTRVLRLRGRSRARGRGRAAPQLRRTGKGGRRIGPCTRRSRPQRRGGGHRERGNPSGGWASRVSTPNACVHRGHLSLGTLPAPWPLRPGSEKPGAAKQKEQSPGRGMRRARWGRGEGGADKGAFKGSQRSGSRAPSGLAGSRVPATPPSLAGANTFPSGKGGECGGNMAKEPSPAPLRLEGPGPFASRRMHGGLGADPRLLIHSVEFRAPGTGLRRVGVGTRDGPWL